MTDVPRVAIITTVPSLHDLAAFPELGATVLRLLFKLKYSTPASALPQARAHRYPCSPASE